MKFRWICYLAVILLLVPQVATAWGGGSSGGGRRIKKVKPKRTFAPPPVPPTVSPEHRHVVSSVSYYVQFRSRDGFFPVPDPDNGDKEWLLKVAQAPTVNKISATKYQVLGAFEGVTEEGQTPVPVVVDFTLNGKDESWAVKKVKLHSVNGTER